MIFVASVVVPCRERQEWRNEWLGEIFYKFSSLSAWRRLNFGHRVALVIRCGGALIDAAALGWCGKAPRWAAGWDSQLRAVAWYAVFSILHSLAPLVAFHVFGLSAKKMTGVMAIADLGQVVASFALVYIFFREISFRIGTKFFQLVAVSSGIMAVALGLSQIGNPPTEGIWTSVEMNLYFTCLILTTILYLVSMRVTAGDERLGLLICGLGIQLAGPAAALALAFLTNNVRLASAFFPWISGCCTLGMLLTWAYAAVQGKRFSSL